MHKRIRTVGFLFILYLICLAVYWLQIGGIYAVPLRDIIYLFTPIAAITGGIFSFRATGFKNIRTKTVFFLTLGIICWFIGEVLWDYYELILKINPFPSIADIFYILAYPLMLIGLVHEIKISGISWKKIYPAIVFLLVIISVLFTTVVLYFGVYLAYNPQETLLTNSIAMSYGIGDLLLIIANIFVLILAWEFRGGKLSRTWFGLFIGFIVMLIADILFGIYTDQYKAQIGIYRYSIDSLYMLSYLIMAYILFNFGFSVRDAGKNIHQLQKHAKK